MSRTLVTQMLNALEYHQLQTRPIHNTELAIEAAREYLETEPIPVQSPARKEFISRLREWDNVTLETSRLYMQKAANMLQADAQEIAVMEHQVEILTDELSRCEKQAKRVPMTLDEIEKLWIESGRDILYMEFKDAVQMTEDHHDITQADNPIGDEPEDLYALALKADNWGQP